MGRHEQREQVFKLLYRVEFHAPEDMPEQIALFRENNEEVPSWQDADAIAARFEKIREKIPELDRLLNENTEGWDTTRMGKVSLQYCALVHMSCAMMTISRMALLLTRQSRLPKSTDRKALADSSMRSLPRS